MCGIATVPSIRQELKRVEGRRLRRPSEARRNEVVIELTGNAKKRHYAVPKSRITDAMNGLPDAVAIDTGTLWFANVLPGR